MGCADRRLYVGVALLSLHASEPRQSGKPDPVKFPRGLRPLSDRAHEMGIRFGLHMPAAQAALSAPIILQHPDWLAYSTVDSRYEGQCSCSH